MRRRMGRPAARQGQPAPRLAPALALALAPTGCAAPPSPPALRIQVLGHQYWWEVLYPDQGVRTANELHIPAGRVVELRLSSADVIHSFWVPQLAGKTDLVSGHENRTWIKADRAG